MDASTLQVPKPLLWPVFILAALAAIIASQALISGAEKRGNFGTNERDMLKEAQSLKTWGAAAHTNELIVSFA